MGQEQQKRFDLPSGAAVAITVAPFSDAWALTKATLKALRGLSVSEGDLNREFASLGTAAISISGILDKLISFATSDEVEAAIFKCAGRALYIPSGYPSNHPGIRIDRNLFDDQEHGEKAREDYALIMARILEVNALPFLAKALSGLKAPTRAAGAAEATASSTPK